MIALHVDCDVLAAPASGIAVYLREVLAALGDEFAITRRPESVGGGASRGFLRRVPGAYRMRSWRAGWPPPPSGAVFWAPNFLLPSWPLAPSRGVATIHDTIFLDHPGWADARRGRFLRAHLAATVRRAARIITPSAAVASRLRELAPDAPCVVVAEGIRRLTAPPAKRRAILCFGNVEPRKGTDTLLAAYRALPAALKEAHPLIVAGAVHDAAFARGMSIVPRPDDATLARLIAESAVVVAPSRAEGFGLVPLEAYVAGACVLASDLAVTKELLADKISYFPAGDAPALGAQLERLLLAPRLPSPGACDELAARFSWRACAAAHAKIFREVAQGEGA